jgi:hypothetical protein
MAQLPPGMTQEQYDQHNLLLRLKDELGANVDFSGQNIILDNDSKYNPFTGQYSVGGGQDAAFWYDPTRNMSNISGVQLRGALDPRAALGMNQDDYSAADTWLNSITSRIDSLINEGVSSGGIAPSYRVVSGGNSGAPVESVFGAEPTQNKLAEIANSYRFNDDSFQDYIERADPELARIYGHLTNERDPWLNQNYLQQAYQSSYSRLNPQDNFYEGLKNQWGDIEGRLNDPTHVSSVQNADIQAIINNPTLSDEVKRTILQDAQTRYGYSIPDEYKLTTPAAPAASQQTTPQAPSKPTASTYAQEMAAPDTSVPEAIQGNTPWSSDFESQMLDVFKGYGNTLQSYLGQGQPKASSNSPVFSLKGYQQSVAMNANTPNTPTALYGTQPSNQSPTGKAGQTNQGTLWS